MRIPPPFIASLLCLSAATVSSGAAEKETREDSAIGTELQAMNPAIETVISGGFWERMDQDGSYRLIVRLEGWEHLANRVFLQWLRRDQDTHQIIVERTVPIAEFDAARWRISEAKFVLAGKQWKIVLRAQPTYEGQKVVFTIVPSADFTYKVTKGTK